MGIHPFGNALLQLKNLLTDLRSLPHHHGDEIPRLLTSLYFGITANEKMLEYRDLVADQLHKIRHSQDIDGEYISLALAAPPIDLEILVKALASGASLASIVSGLSAPLPNYRFWFMIETAVGLAFEIKQLGGVSSPYVAT